MFHVLRNVSLQRTRCILQTLTIFRFHILWNHSCTVSKFCNKLDYLGILVLMWGAGVPTIYYGFPCDYDLRLTYWGMVRCDLPHLLSLVLTQVQTSVTALCCTFLTLSPRFGSPQFRHWRATFYAGFGLSSIFFVIHGLTLYGWEVQKDRMSLVWMGWMATANLLGAAIYAARVITTNFRMAVVS
jgi:adiponectin receptor